MIAFIGSTMGNLWPEECDRFLAHVSNALSVGDFFLLGIDLQKEISILEAAYNDTQGITAQFNLNMLSHLNRRFSANFNDQQFAHVAIYNSQAHQIEMYLESLVAQTVTLKDLNFTIFLEKEERILSEISRKFNIQATADLLQLHHLSVIETFHDPNVWFALLLCQRSEPRLKVSPQNIT